MIPKVIFDEWYLNPDIDSIFIDFTGKSGGEAYSYLELPEDIDTDIEGYPQTENEDYWNYIEIINPKPLLESSFIETLVINGYKIKDLILEAYEKEIA